MVHDDWNGRLTDTHSVEGVIGLAREFVAGWTPEEIERLPADCRPPALNTVDDIAGYALTLVQKIVIGDATYAPRLNTMANFMVTASTRMSQILALAARKAAVRKERV